MQETLLISNNLNQTEMLRTMAKFGFSTFGMRIMSPVELAKYVLEENGIVLASPVIDDDFYSYFCFNDFRNIEYFKNINLSDSKNIVSSFWEIQANCSIPFDIEELLAGEFEKKNSAIVECYNIYKKNVDSGFIDKFGLINLVINKRLKTKAKVVYLNGFDLNRLDLSLINSVSDNPKSYNLLSEDIIDIKEYARSYGMFNEVEHVFNIISNNNYKLDECLIVIPSKYEYLKTIEDKCISLNLKYSSNIKTPLYALNSSKLYRDIIEYEFDFCNPEKMISFITSDYFLHPLFLSDIKVDAGSDTTEYLRTIEAIASMRFSFFDKVANDKKVEGLDENGKYFAAICNAKDIINNGAFAFCTRYMHLHADFSKDIKALDLIEKYTTLGARSEIPFDIVIKDIFKRSVSGLTSSEGELFITSIEKAAQTLRRHVFFLGLSSNLFPGSPKENPIMLDSDYEIFGIKDYSKNKILKKVNILVDTLRLCNTFKSDVYLSYSDYDAANLKEQSASSVLFDIYKSQNKGATLDDFSKSLVKIGYFDSNINSNISFGKFLKGASEVEIRKVVVNNKAEVTKEIKKDYLDHYYSPSSIDNFFKCPLRFYLKSILYVYEGQDISDDLPSSGMGIIIHKVMERYMNIKNRTRADFEQIKTEEFLKYFKEHVPSSPNIINDYLEEYNDILENAYELSKDDKLVLLSEKDMYATHESGVKIHGLPDLYVLKEDGSYWIVDYKVKNGIDHKLDDNKTLMQILIYAYILIKNGKKVDGCEFRYLKQKEVIGFSDIEKRLTYLNDYLVEFKQGLLDAAFDPIAIDEINGPCKFCKYIYICNNGKVSEDD